MSHVNKNELYQSLSHALVTFNKNRHAQLGGERPVPPSPPTPPKIYRNVIFQIGVCVMIAVMGGALFVVLYPPF